MPIIKAELSIRAGDPHIFTKYDSYYLWDKIKLHIPMVEVTDHISSGMDSFGHEAIVPSRNTWMTSTNDNCCPGERWPSRKEHISKHRLVECDKFSSDVESCSFQEAYKQYQGLQEHLFLLKEKFQKLQDDALMNPEVQQGISTDISTHRSHEFQQQICEKARGPIVECPIGLGAGTHLDEIKASYNNCLQIQTHGKIVSKSIQDGSDNIKFLEITAQGSDMHNSAISSPCVDVNHWSLVSVTKSPEIKNQQVCGRQTIQNDLLRFESVPDENSWDSEERFPTHDSPQIHENFHAPKPGGAGLYVKWLHDQLEHRNLEISGLRSTVATLEKKILDRALPKVAINEVLVLRRRNNELEKLLHDSKCPNTSASDIIHSVKRNLQLYNLNERSSLENSSLLSPKASQGADTSRHVVQDTVATWHTNKRLQSRISKLEKKLKECQSLAMQMQETNKKLENHVKLLNRKLSQEESAHKELETRLKSAEAKGPYDDLVPASSMKSLLKEMHSMQEKCFLLERQLALQYDHVPRISDSSDACTVHCRSDSDVALGPPAFFAKQIPPPCDNTGKMNEDGELRNSSECEDSRKIDLMILDLQLQKDQAVAYASTLQARLEILCAEFGQYHAKVRQGSVERNRLSRSREGELLDTIKILRKALERARLGLQNGVSNSQYMRVVEKARAASCKIKLLEAQLQNHEQIKEKLAKAQSDVSLLQTTTASLRGKLWHYKHQVEQLSQTQKDIMNAQVIELERALRERDEELSNLRTDQCEELRILIEAGLTPRMLVAQLIAARSQLEEVSRREAALRARLKPFDSEFMEELQQLRTEHRQMRDLCISMQRESCRNITDTPAAVAVAKIQEEEDGNERK